jgi:uncharacterized RDD family membrane protein YckC
MQPSQYPSAPQGPRPPYQPQAPQPPQQWQVPVSGQQQYQPYQAPGQPPQGQYPGAPQPGGWNQPAYGGGLYRVPSTPDGQPLAGYGQRVVAFLLDWVIQLVVWLVVGGVFLANAMSGYLDEFDRLTSEAQSGAQPDVSRLMASIDRGQLVLFSVVGILVFVVYQVFFLSRFGATPGKMALGISVRLRQQPGPLPFGDAVKRVALPVGLFVVQALPFIGLVGVLGRALDLLWPAWDDKRQALHDKVAATNVVVGRQPRRR